MFLNAPMIFSRTASVPVGVSVIIRHPGQVPRSGMRAGIQNDLRFRHFPGFRVSPQKPALYTCFHRGRLDKGLGSPGMTVLLTCYIVS